MGTLRLLLAFAVVIAHSQPLYGFVGIGSSAVPAFFIISGFYMCLVLSTTYNKPGAIRLFYINRFLRLFPLYWSVLLIFYLTALLTQTGDHPFFDRVIYLARNSIQPSTDGTVASAWAAIPNLFVIGSDILRLFAITPETGDIILMLQSDYQKNYIGMDKYLVMPQIWSLGVELVCYAVAPFLVRLKTTWLTLFLLLFIWVQVYSNASLLTWKHLPSWYNFSYFLLGILSFRLSRWLSNRTPKPAAYMAASFPFVLWAFYPSIAQMVSGALIWGIWGLYALGMTTLFSLTKNLAWDRNLGNLSYPVYLIHWLFSWPAVTFGAAQPVAAMAASCLVSWMLIKLIDDPVEKIKKLRGFSNKIALSATVDA